MTDQTEKKERVPRRPNRPLLVLVCLVVAAIVAINMAFWGLLAPHLDIVNVFTKRPDTTTETYQQARQDTADITEQIEAEGIILLKNDGSLPLANKKVNVLGSTAGNNFSYGGTGSGAGDESSNVSFYQGLANAGIEVNPDLKSFYEANAASAIDYGLVGTDWNLYELPQSSYDANWAADARAYSDTAIVVITRKGGEGYDLPMDMADYKGSEAGRSYLELTPNEEDLVAVAEETFDHVIVVLNSPNAMELGWLEDERIDSALWVGTVGATGCNAIGNVLTGEVNPSGKTVDTFPYAVESAPSYYNFGDYSYSNATYANTSMFSGTGDAVAGQDSYHYVEYQEGIYVGYRYYETAAADGYIDYASTVQFPFGYGLSYTTFSETLDSVVDDGTNITCTVTVTNTGSVAGKQVAEIYVAAPYTTGGIEKSSVVLAGFDKTKLLEPGESQTLSISFAREDMASYDYSGVKAEGGAYVLEAGDYGIQLQTDSHNVVASQTVHVDADVIYNDANDGKRSSDEVAATNQFDDVSNGDGLTYVSRADWAGTMPTTRAAATKEATAEQVKALTDPEPLDNSETEDIVTGKKNGLTLADMKGLDYDDAKWSDLLDQVSLSEMKILVGNAGWLTASVESVGKPALVECDGPNGINNLMVGINGTQFTGQSVLGQTWNVELASRLGELFAAEAKANGVAGVYAPAVNTHRSAFGGRNYEYVSEDGLLAGKVIAAEVKSIQANGVYCYTKHFAANDQETHRADGGLVTWLNEQAMREIYLRPFEIIVKEGGCTGMMSSYNRLGTTPTAESYALLTTVLRGEWGFCGAVITDCTMAGATSDVNRSLRAGQDLNLNFLQDLRMTSDTTDTAAGHQALRRATHNVLYMVANSDALETGTAGIAGTIKTGIVVFDVVVVALVALYFWRRHVGMVRWRKAGKPRGWISRKIHGEA
ncbi:glycoside hydrolase family 3 C-terminal domain-containing protein [Paratractidigestivibacter sp.]|uniref:glycoside hydrolase family 3 C-terminal domain-containing protein n=1 Tax=Paratractidigestivibacter sp. TaxID=2847316 RepID=UPI002AC9AC6A|nr:glycoside hydrolase family 3 C-terminal domain-containing protein [Paratractidigestivibacter sp.]